jgi:rhodanese-related sulfurtransferase
MDQLIIPERLREQLSGDQPPVVIDVRTKEAYQAGHIPGAIHIPGQELRRRLAEIPRDRNIVVY